MSRIIDEKLGAWMRLRKKALQGQYPPEKRKQMLDDTAEQMRKCGMNPDTFDKNQGYKE